MIGVYSPATPARSTEVSATHGTACFLRNGYLEDSNLWPLHLTGLNGLSRLYHEGIQEVGLDSTSRVWAISAFGVLSTATPPPLPPPPPGT